MIRSFLAQRLRFLRKKAQLTQEEVAKHLNIERQTYCNYENETRTPPLEMIILLADFYGVTIDYLVKEDGRDGTSFYSAQSLLTNTEEVFLNSFRSLSSRNQQEVLQFIQFKSYISSSDK